MKNLLVTGGAGFIGSCFVRMMIRKYPDYRIVVYDKLTYAGNLNNLLEVHDDPRYAFVRGDIADKHTLEAAIREHAIDTVVNFAAESHVDRSILQPDAFIHTDVVGTYVLLEAARRFGLERFHQVSSVTGDTPLLVRHDVTGEIALRPIAELEGETLSEFSVLTLTREHQVAFQPMRHFVKHPVDRVYEISYNGGGRLRATASHSVFVVTEAGIATIPTSELKVGDYLVTFVGDVLDGRQPHTFDLRQLLAANTYEGLEPALHKRQVVLAGVVGQGGATHSQLRAAVQAELSEGTTYRLLTALSQEGYLQKTDAGVYVASDATVTDGLLHASQQRWQLVKHKLHIPADELTVDATLMEVFGLYLAEGHSSHTPTELAGAGRSVTFTLGLNETAQVRLLQRCAREKFQIDAHVKRRESTYQVTYSSRWVHALFSQFGATAGTKRLPGWIWVQPKELIAAFFKGYEGDAAIKRDGRRYFTSVNRALIVNLLWLARMNDVNCLMSSRTVRQEAGLVPPGITVSRERQFYDLQITAENARRGESGPWRSPMSRCIPSAMVAQACGARSHKGVHLHRKPLVSKTRAAQFAATFAAVPVGLTQLLASPVGMAKIKNIRVLDGDFMVYDVSVPGNERFFGGNVPCLLHNTDEVYGSIPQGYFKEGDPLEPNSPYSASKAGGELMVRAYHETYGLNTVATRGSNTFGPYQYPEKVAPLFITNAIDDEPLPLYGDGMQVRDWLYVEDHCAGIDWVLHHGPAGEIYNLGGGNERHNIEVTRLILTLLGKPDSLIRPVADRPGHDRRYALDCSKLAALGFEPEHKFEDAMAKTVRWYQENEWWWRPIKTGEFREFYSKQYGERLTKAGQSSA